MRSEGAKPKSQQEREKREDVTREHEAREREERDGRYIVYV